MSSPRDSQSLDDHKNLEYENGRDNHREPQRNDKEPQGEAWRQNTIQLSQVTNSSLCVQILKTL